jgi:hypothetical protein
MLGLLLSLALLSACDSGETLCCSTGAPAVRLVNAYTSPVDVLIDGNVAISAMPAGAIDTVSASAGDHTITLRPTGSGSSAAQAVTTANGALSTIAIVRNTAGSVASAVLDDTNAVVPSGATKVSVLHLAPNAGTIQVYRTQPDYQQPISWQFPFNYQPEPTSLSAPFYQSTVGSWEVRAWQSPADASGWDTAPVKVVIPLASGEKKTVIILDKDGGGIRVELL